MCNRINEQQAIGVLAALLVPMLAAASDANWNAAYYQGLDAFNQARYSDAEAKLKSAVEQARAFSAPDMRFAKSTYSLAVTYHLQGKSSLAEPLYLEAQTAVQQLGREGQPMMGYVLQGLGELRFDQGRWKEGEPLLRQAIAQCRTQFGERHPCTLAAQKHLGQLLTAFGPSEEAQALLENLIANLRQLNPPSTEMLVGSLANLGVFHLTQGNLQSAEPLLRESLDIANQHGISGPVLADTLLDLGELYRLQQNTARAEPLLRKALSIYECANDPHQAGALHELGKLAMNENKFAIAKGYLSESLRMYERVAGSENLLTARVKAALAQALLGDRNTAQAREMVREALAVERNALGEKHSEYARYLMLAAKIEEAAHRNGEADGFYRQALAVYRESLSEGQQERVDAERSYDRFAKSLRK